MKTPDDRLARRVEPGLAATPNAFAAQPVQSKSLSETVVERGLVEAEALRRTLERQTRTPDKRLVTLLLDQGLLSDAQLWTLAGEGAVNESELGALYLGSPPTEDHSGLLRRVRARRPFPGREGRDGGPLADSLAALEPIGTAVAAAPGHWPAPVLRAGNGLLVEAIFRGASSLHVEPEREGYRLALRQDGAMIMIGRLPQRSWAPLAERFRALAGLSGREARKGEILVRLGERSFACRLAFSATRQGESLVIGFKERCRTPQPLEELALSDRNLVLLHKALARPTGLTLFAGPALSCRTTTLYSMVRRLASPQRSQVALTPDCEFALPGVSDIAADAETVIDAVAELRHQDNDLAVIDLPSVPNLVPDLLSLAVSRRVFATLDGSDTLGTLAALVAGGVSPSRLGAALTAIVSQRLVRRLCPDCKESREMTADEMRLLSIKVVSGACAGHAVGCPKCDHTGYAGRIVLAEVLVVDAVIADLIEKGAPRGAIREAAAKRGFRSLLEDGVQKVLSGTVSLNELARTLNLAAHF